VALNSSILIGPDRNGRSIAVANGVIAASPAENAGVLRCDAGEIKPGAVCAHTHLYSGLGRYGMPAASPPPENFLQVLERIWWRLDRALDASTLRAAAMDYVARALLAGTTALVDHHESPNLIEGSLAILAAVCEQLGMRALLCYGATERNAGRDEANRGLQECRRVPASPLIRGLVGLHASFTASDATVRAAGELARELGTVLHVHVAEDGADMEDARSRGFNGPLERLANLGALVPGSILAHGVHLNREQVEMAGSLSCWLVHNPRSNEANRVGYASNLQYGCKVALGSDGWSGDMAEEQDALFRLAKLHGDARARGRLEEGHRLIAERFDSEPEPLSPGALADVVVWEEGRVRHSVIGGSVVVQDGELSAGDIDEISATARNSATRLWNRMRMI
jgi:cytosine/adenosine deaminase-related metal-dependent hydrolase